MHRSRTLAARSLLAAIAIGAFLLLPVSRAQDVDAGNIHWAYSSYFGSGWYSVDGDRDVFVARMTGLWQLTEPSLGDDGERKLGLYFRLPVSLGLDRFSLDDPLDAVDLDNVSFLIANPAVGVEIPVNRRWSLRPFASLGYGTALDGSQSAWTYWAGVKSRLSFRSGRLEWQLLNRFGFVGYAPDDGPSDGTWPLMTALEFAYPLGDSADADRQRLLHWHVGYTQFASDVNFDGVTRDQSIRDEWQIGVAIGRREVPIFTIWGFEFERLGLAYLRSSGGDLEGITFVFSSLFEQ